MRRGMRRSGGEPKGSEEEGVLLCRKIRLHL